MKTLIDQNIESFFQKNKNIIYVFSFISTLFFTWTYFSLSWDDSYIAFRYALNLVDNGIWNWNNDYNFVEAYTNFSYAALSTIPIFFKIDPTIFLKFVNFLWMAIIVYQLKKDLHSVTLFSIGLLLTALNPFIHYHIATGMETIFFLFLIFEALRHVIRKNETKKAETLFYIILLLLPLTRPEGVLYSIVFFAVSFFIKKNKIQCKKELIIVISIALIYALWRYFYFEQFLPNTFYLKSVKGSSFRNFFIFLNDIKLYLIVLVILNIFLRNKIFTVLSVLTIFIAVFVYAPSDLNTTINDRFSIQIFLPLFLASLYLISEINYKSLLILFILFYTASYTEYSKIFRLSPQSYYYKEIGKALSKFSDKNYTLMIGEAGIIPYYSNWRTYDFIGLANNHLSRNKITTEYVENISPDIIMLYGSGKSATEMRRDFYSQGVIIDYMNINKNYNFIGNVFNGKWCLKVFMKANIKDYDLIKKSLDPKLAQTYEYEGKTLYNVDNIRKWFTFQYLK